MPVVYPMKAGKITNIIFFALKLCEIKNIYMIKNNTVYSKTQDKVIYNLKHFKGWKILMLYHRVGLKKSPMDNVINFPPPDSF